MDLENVMRPEHIFHRGKPGKFGRAAGFCSDLAYILVFGYKWLGEDPKSITLSKAQFKKDPYDDRPILEAAFEIMSQADVVITWYGSGHDVPFLATRLSQQGIYLDPSIKHIDLYQVASKKMRLSSNSLDNTAKFFGLPQKTKVSPKLWADCWAGNYDSLQEMARYCEQDCEVLSTVFEKMKPLGIKLPHIGKHLGKDPARTCEVCGSESLIGNGYRVTKMKRYRRLRCTQCGSHKKGEQVE